MSMILNVLGGGAAKGIVGAVSPAFTAATGAKVEGAFSAVGAVRTSFVAGAACDVLILTEALTRSLTDEGKLVRGSSAAVGTVRAGVAVPEGHAAPDISTPQALKSALLASKGIYVPDLQQSTAGQHLAKVFAALQLDAQVLARIRPFPNGETAMGRMSADRLPDTIGSTQMTEIRATPGLTLVGPLPQEFELSTVYVAAVSATSANPALAYQMVMLLTGAGTKPARMACGFEP